MTVQPGDAMPRGKNKGKLLAAGLDLIYQQGFHASGVQEIADASGVPKGSFYNYFKSKDDFAEQVLEHYTEKLSHYLDQTLIQASGSPLTRLRAMVQDWTEQSLTEDKGYGCLTGNLCQELAKQNPQVQQAVDRSFNQLQAYFVACLTDAQAAGELDPNADPALLAAFIYNAWQGALLRTKSQENNEALVQFQTVVFDRLLA